ncbi:esterase/lipase family protein [Aliikangiella sp. IMCC44653]
MKAKQNQAQVILLHGMARSPRNLAKLERQLKAHGYRVLNIGYNCFLNDYPQILEKLTKQIQAWLINNAPLHFVAHSFGGILSRGLIQANPHWQVTSCVFIGTPNQGTKTAEYMCNHWLLKHLTPPVTKQLTPHSPLLKTLEEPACSLGIIAGNKNFSWLIPVSWFYANATNQAPGDGVVEISNTQCRNMTDFIIMPLHHSFMTWDSHLIEEVRHFLNHNQFSQRFKSQLTT